MVIYLITNVTGVSPDILKVCESKGFYMSKDINQGSALQKPQTRTKGFSNGF
jgi:hypothetical protein